MLLRKLLRCNLTRKLFYCQKMSPTRRSYANPPPSETETKPVHHVARHKYHQEVEAVVNQQILMEFNAGMFYLTLACYYGRTDVTMLGSQAYFNKMYLEEMEHAVSFINYQLMRGGRVRLFPTTTPENQEFGCVTVALALALDVEKHVKEQLEFVLRTAEKHNDLQLVDMMESVYIAEQNQTIRDLGALLKKGQRVVDAGKIGKYLFDEELFKLYANNSKVIRAS